MNGGNIVTVGSWTLKQVAGQTRYVTRSCCTVGRREVVYHASSVYGGLERRRGRNRAQLGNDERANDLISRLGAQ